MQTIVQTQKHTTTIQTTPYSTQRKTYVLFILDTAEHKTRFNLKINNITLDSKLTCYKNIDKAGKVKYTHTHSHLLNQVS